MRLAINPACAVAWTPIDDHGAHALIADDFLADAPALREYALSLAYQPPARPDNYPGLKALASLVGAAETKTWIARQVLDRLYPGGAPAFFATDAFDAAGAFAVFACDRDRPPPDLEDQHTDGFAWLAAVLHLSHVVGDRGTAIWEHWSTGFQQ